VIRLSLIVALICVAPLAQATVPSSDPESLDLGFHEMYNLNFPEAHRIFEMWQQSHPTDPIGAAANAAAYLFSEFARLHILELELFTDSRKLDNLEKASADPELKAAFEAELSKADAIANTGLAESSDNRNALFARVLVEGLRGDYAVLIEKRNRAGLDFLQTSRSIAEKLIALDPTFYDAYLAVGIENYLLGLRAAPTRWLLRLSGSQTNKDKGIAALNQTAENGRYLKPYARLLIAIAALRDNDKSKAKQLLSDLSKQFPQNRLYRLELSRLRS
jgi:hypothetical protein